MSMESMVNRSCRFLGGSRSLARVAPGTPASPALPLASAFLVAALLCGCGGRAEHGSSNNVGGADSGSAGAATNMAGGLGSGAVGGVGGPGAGETCSPGRAPLRRLTNAEYTKTVASLFGDGSGPTSPLPEESHPFPSDSSAAKQVGLNEATVYFQAAKEVAARATQDPEALAALAPCAGAAEPDAACARTSIEMLATKAFRRAPTEQELSELLALHTSVANHGGDFADATRTVITAVLQAPDFLYRVELGTGEGPRADVQRLTGDEMATRLSYLVWGTSPDDDLRAAAQSGALLEPGGIKKQASRLLADPRSRAGLSAFFDDFLELYRLPELQRADPSYSPRLGTALQEATQRFLQAQIFDQNASWPSVLTSSKAFVNGSVASLYGVVGVTGEQWQEVSLAGTERLGLLTHPSWLMTSLPTNSTNPTQRGYRIMEKILCRDVPPEPPNLPPLPSDPPVGATTRQRWSQFTSPPACVPCHHDMDQLGYAFEVFDSMGRYRSQENGVDIDTKVDVTGLGSTSGPVELVKKLAALPETGACFAQRFAEFGLGKPLASDPAGTCLKQDIARRFEAGGYNVRQLLLDLTQTDAFLYLPKER
jgi:hypothetical protein